MTVRGCVRGSSRVMLLSLITMAIGACVKESHRTIEAPTVASHGTPYDGPKYTLVVGKFQNRSQYLRRRNSSIRICIARCSNDDPSPSRAVCCKRSNSVDADVRMWIERETRQRRNRHFSERVSRVLVDTALPDRTVLRSVVIDNR